MINLGDRTNKLENWDRKLKLVIGCAVRVLYSSFFIHFQKMNLDMGCAAQMLSSLFSILSSLRPEYCLCGSMFVVWRLQALSGALTSQRLYENRVFCLRVHGWFMTDVEILSSVRSAVVGLRLSMAYAALVLEGLSKDVDSSHGLWCLELSTKEVCLLLMFSTGCAALV